MSAVVLSEPIGASRTQARGPVNGRQALILDADGNPTWRYRTETFRDAFLASGLTGDELDRRCGWTSGQHARVLGLRPESTTKRDRDGQVRHYRTIRRTISYENAVRLCRAPELDLCEWQV